MLLLCAVRVVPQGFPAEQWQLVLMDGQEVGNIHVRSSGLEGGGVRTEVYQTLALRRFGQEFSVSQRSIWVERPGPAVGELGGGRVVPGERGAVPRERGTVPGERGAVPGERTAPGGVAGRAGAGSPRLILDRVESVLVMNGRRQMIEAVAGSGAVEVRRREGQRTDERRLPTRGPVLGLYGADRLLARAVTASWDAEAAGPAPAGASARVLHLSLFSPESGTLEEIEATLLGPGELVDSRGDLHQGMLVEQRSSALPGMVSREIYGSDGSLRYSRTDAGVPLEIIGLPIVDPGRGVGVAPRGPGAREATSPRDPEAAGARPGPGTSASGLFDVAAFVIPVAGLPERPGALCRLRDPRISFTGEGVAVLAEAVRSSLADLGGAGPRPVAEQVREVAGTPSLVVELDEPAPPERLEPVAEGDPALDETARACLRDGFHLGLDDPKLERLLGACPESRSLCLEGAVNRYLTMRSFGRGFAGLQEVLDSREGDCTEASLLLVGLLRKLGVPARQAYGLLLTEGGLVGHAWTEVYQDGRWQWLDPSFPGGAPYGFKLRLGTLDPAEPVWGQFDTALLSLRSSVRAELLP